MIKSFADKRTAAMFLGICPKGIPAELVKRAKAKMALVDAAVTIEFLRSPPGNRLEALVGDRIGQHSVRVNDQWCICFVFCDGNAYDVEFCDCH